MQVWLDRKLYPEEMRAEVRARIRGYHKQCTPKDRAYLRSLAATGKACGE